MIDLVERLRITLDLCEAGIALQRQALRRQFPEKSERDIDQLLNKWLSDRPGAEHGDGPQPPTHGRDDLLPDNASNQD